VARFHCSTYELRRLQDTESKKTRHVRSISESMDPVVGACAKEVEPVYQLI